MIVKWENLKKKVILSAVGNVPYFYEKMVPLALSMSIHDEKFNNWRERTEWMRQEFIKVIENWDIRMVKKLIELFPDIIPIKYQRKTPVCFQADNENADWLIEFS